MYTTRPKTEDITDGVRGGRRQLKPEARKFLRDLGDTIRAVRRDRGLHQEHVGTRACISGSRVGEIERGRVNTSIARVACIAEALGTTAAALLRRQELESQDERLTETVRARLIAAIRGLSAVDVELLAQFVARMTRE